jgi:hypothetical protein
MKNHCINWVTPIINLIGSFLGAGVALIIYYKQVQKEKRKENEQELGFQKDTLNYFTHVLKNIITITEKQAKECEALIPKIAQNPVEYQLLRIAEGSEFYRVVSVLSQEKVYRAYLTAFNKSNQAVDDFRVIYSFLDFGKTTYDDMKKFIETVSKTYQSTGRKYIEAGNDFIDEVASQENKIKISNHEYEKDPYHNFLNQALSVFYDQVKNENNGQKTIGFVQARFVEPVKAKLVHEFRNELSSELLINKAKSTTYIYAELLDISRHYSEGLSRYSGDLLKTSERLKERSKNLFDKFDISTTQAST